MKIYLLLLAAGVFVGVIYGLLNIRYPAPSIVALIGLLGILAGDRRSRRQGACSMSLASSGARSRSQLSE